MRPFRYEQPADAAEAVALLEREPGAKFLAGGTNLVDLMRLGVEQPPVLVDVRRLPFGAVEETPSGGLMIGAGVPNSDLAADELVRERYPVLADAILHGASGQLRNLATTGGNLLQRTRCFYFQDVTKPCNKREPGSGCPAREGEHHNLAILGWTDACVATYPGDMSVALAALDATVHVVGPAGERAIPFAGFHRLPESEPDRDTTLASGELITAVELPPLTVARRSAYRKARERASFSFALVSVAAALELEDGRISDVRLALGNVAHVPWRAARAEQELRGAAPTEDAFARAAAVELAQARPLRDNAFKVELARNLIVRTLQELL